ncbi:hypothetical protein HK096_003724, partial [Nowakowskiella sp. JEL0078]
MVSLLGYKTDKSHGAYSVSSSDPSKVVVFWYDTNQTDYKAYESIWDITAKQFVVSNRVDPILYPLLIWSYAQYFPCESWFPQVGEMVDNPYFMYNQCASPEPQFSGTSPYMCNAIIFSKDYIAPLLQKVSPTPNSRIVLLDRKGYMLATNMNITLTINKNFEEINLKVLLNQTDDPIIRDMSAALIQDSNYTKLGNLAFDPSSLTVASTDIKKSIEQRLSDNRIWYIFLITVNFGTSNKYFVLMGVPRDEFFGQVDSSIQNGITMSSVFVALGIVTGIIVIVAVLLPLKKLQISIQSVTKFDFSMLSSGGLVENSVFTEIKAVQQVFNIMVKAFASAIKVNKEMQKRTIDSTSSKGAELSKQISR